jgi:hypothetical protein
MPDTSAKLPLSSTGVSSDGPRHQTAFTDTPGAHTLTRSPRVTTSRTNQTQGRSSSRRSSEIDLTEGLGTPDRASKHNVSSSPASSRTNPRSSHVAIGMIFSNGEVGQDQYRCTAPGCHNKTFGRLAELKRHHAGKHAAAGRKPQFWCPVEGCERSRAGQGEAFPRKDKMFDHLSRMHPDVVGSG